MFVYSLWSEITCIEYDERCERKGICLSFKQICIHYDEDMMIQIFKVEETKRRVILHEIDYRCAVNYNEILGSLKVLLP